MNKIYYSYQDIFLLPSYSNLRSRDQASVSINYGPREFKLPVVPANMACVIDTNIAKWLSENGYFYIMHRFNKNHADEPNKDNMEFLVRANVENWKTISISLGVQEYDKEFLREVAKRNLRIDYLTIDIAHGHSIKMREMLMFIKNEINLTSNTNPYSDSWTSVPLPYKPFVIAGNVGAPLAVTDLENWGADSVKIGLSQGAACSTFGMTGFGAPMFSSVLECSRVATKPLIADGGIRTNGDFAKAIVAGATMVMAGSVFAACKDAPGESIHESVPYMEFDHDTCGTTKFRNGEVLRKVYYGSASEYNKHTKRHVEGTKLELPCNGKTYEEKYQEIADSYSSAVSYAGGNLRDVEWGVRNS